MSQTDILQAGEIAPTFTLPRDPDTKISLSSFEGRPVILAFYPADWSPVCGDQMSLYNEMLPMFTEHNAQLLGISVDSPWSHKAFAEQKKLKFPILSDFEPKGAVAREYGVYGSDGMAERALFVIDPNGLIQWSHLSPNEENPGADGILRALEEIDVEVDFE